MNGTPETYDNAIGAGNLPDEFKDGKPFYFKVSQVNKHGIITAECSPTGYIVEFERISRTDCPGNDLSAGN